MSASPDLLWQHSCPASTNLHAFLTYVAHKHNLPLTTYADLHRWSTTHLALFWADVAAFTQLVLTRPATTPLAPSARMFPRPVFFPGARLNFARNLLYPACAPGDADIAILAATETQRAEVSWGALRARAHAVQAGMRRAGVRAGDRVAGYVGNHADAVAIMLAATSVGAVWTAISPDSGVSMVLDRLRQIAPTLLFADARQEYGGRVHDVLGKVGEIAAGLESLEGVVVLPTVSGEERQRVAVGKGSVQGLDEFATGAEGEMQFEELEADHPVYILYSSGTTGAPKCIVHGAVGTLLQHKKEHVLHSDVRAGERFFYFTTVTWMMWHWLVSGLASGATLVLYDGSPMRYRSSRGASEPDDLAMPKLIDELKINHFGTSAKYLSILEQKGLFPKESPHHLTLSSLRAIYNTASPLAPSTFRYVYKAFGPDLMLASITGGTDIVSLFGAGCPLAPVYAGEVQVPGLGMDIRAFSEEGEDVTESGLPGDLVCVKPFPCQPVFFWPPGDEGQAKYEKSYFQRFKVDGHAVWHHGDYIEFRHHPTGPGLMMLGRSDGVLNPAGIRFGSAEIYNVLLRHFPGAVSDGLCVGRKREGESDETVVLFVKMESGHDLSQDLVKEIKTAVRSDLSARHVPSIIDECPDIPVTINGKK